MIAPDDARHGTTRGYHAGCRDTCCRRAISRYEKHCRVRRLSGERWAIPAIGAQRRIQALMRLGWTAQDIADEAGWKHRNSVLRIINGQKGKPTTWLERKTATTIAEVFERLSMRLPADTPQRVRAREVATARGWAPPLAWDCIDDPDEQPTGIAGQQTEPDRGDLLTELNDRGATIHEAARELGITTDGIYMWCRRNGHLDLWDQMSTRTRTSENAATKRKEAA